MNSEEVAGLECGWHARGQNNIDYLAICLTGWWDRRTPSEAQLSAARDLEAALQHDFGKWYPVVGHKDLGASACPGDTWEQWRGRVTVSQPAPEPPPVDPQAARIKELEAEVTRWRTWARARRRLGEMLG
jgi:hypothetical protein